MTAEEIIKYLIAKTNKFRLGSSKYDELCDDAEKIWTDPNATGDQYANARIFEGYRRQFHPPVKDGKIYHLEEFDGEMWRLLGTGEAGMDFQTQCVQILKQVMEEEYLDGCGAGSYHWSCLPSASSIEEFELKLHTLNI